MLPGVKDLKIYQGSYFLFPFILKEKDLTGYSAKMQIRDRNNQNLLLELTTENEKLKITPESGRVDIIISPEETKILQSGIYDLFLIDEDEKPEAYLTGNVIVTPAITR